MKKISNGNFVLFITAVSYLVLGILFSLATQVFNIDIPVTYRLFLTQSAIILPTIIYASDRKQSIPKMIRFKKTRPINFLMAFLVMICTYPVVIFFNLVTMMFSENAVGTTLGQLQSSGGFILTFVLVAILPALFEETLFRGVVYGSYSKRSPVAGIFISAFMFGLMHGNINQMSYAVILGIVFVFMLEATDSIWIPMFMHLLLNSVSVIISGLAANINQGIVAGTLRGTAIGQWATETLYMWILVIYGIIALVFSAGTVGLIIATFRINKRRFKDVFRSKKVPGEKNPIIDGWLIGAFVVLLVMVILQKL